MKGGPVWVVTAPGSREEGRERACVQPGLPHPESSPSAHLPSDFTLCSYDKLLQQKFRQEKWVDATTKEFRVTVFQD